MFVIALVWVYSKEDTMVGIQANDLLVTLSQDGVLDKRLMHINEMVIWPSLWSGTAVCSLDIENTGGLGLSEYY